MARKKNPSLTQYQTMLQKFNWNWEMEYEMQKLDDVPIKVRAKNEAIEDELLL